MRKVLVIGSAGAGKSTFARRMGEITGLPVIHLDRHFWHAGWVETPKDEWRSRVAKLIEGDRWIIDGNYGGTMDMRLAACDTVIFLDLPRLVCALRVLKRIVTYMPDARPDLAEGCGEKFDLEFLRWIWNYPAVSRPGVERRLAGVDGRVRVIRLTSRRAVRLFLAEIEAAGKRL